MMLEIVLPACQTAILIGFSALVYQEDVTDESQLLQWFGGVFKTH